jgi:hypothetical protein
VNRHRRFVTLVQMGLAKDLASDAAIFYLAFFLELPEEAIPTDVTSAAREVVRWAAGREWHQTERHRDDCEICSPIPPWITEWLEQENRPNPFESLSATHPGR